MSVFNRNDRSHPDAVLEVYEEDESPRMRLRVYPCTSRCVLRLCVVLQLHQLDHDFHVDDDACSCARCLLCRGHVEGTSVASELRPLDALLEVKQLVSGRRLRTDVR